MAKGRWLVLVCTLAITSGCGTRVEEQGALGNRSDSVPAALAPVASGNDPGNATGAPAPEAEGSSPGGSEVGVSAAPATTQPRRAVTTTTIAGSSGTQGAATGERAPDRGQALTTSTTAPLGASLGKKSPVITASVGTYSGPVGAAFVPFLRATQTWVSFINARGGLNGHPVELITYDDGGDPARSKAQVQDAIERRRVIAFLQNSQAISGQGSVEYIASKRIPVIGTDTGTPWVYDQPMWFPQTSSTDANIAATIHAAAQQVLPQGKSKIGWLTCVESTSCNEAVEKVFSEAAPRLGFQVVYQGRTSLGQPDFTAECLAARNAGAQIMLVMLDANSVRRYATACDRQGYRPALSFVSTATEDGFKDLPSLDGSFAPSIMIPWFTSGTPGLEEFKQAIRSFAKNVSPGIAPLAGWASGKLLEEAGANLPEPPTSAAILDGLWSIKNDDLGGLTQPLTFVRDKPTAKAICFWNVRISKGAWETVGDGQRHCVK